MGILHHTLQGGSIQGLDSGLDQKVTLLTSTKVIGAKDAPKPTSDAAPDAVIMEEISNVANKTSSEVGQVHFHPDEQTAVLSMDLDDSICQGATRFKTKTRDSGKKISKRFYPEDDVLVTWALIVTCSKELQERYKECNVTDKASVPFDTVRGMKLLIPVKRTVMEVPVVGNLTFGDLIANSTNDMAEFNLAFTDDVDDGIKNTIVANLNLTRSTDIDEGVKNSGGRRLWGYTEGGGAKSLNSYPGKKVGDWNLYQCIPMFNRDRKSKVTIITHGNSNCESMWNYCNDGCSSPVWSAYTNSFTPACQRHDVCKSLCIVC